MSIIGILKIMEMQEDDMEMQEEAVFSVLLGPIPCTLPIASSFCIPIF